MADEKTQPAAPQVLPVAPQASAVTKMLFKRDYWPKNQPGNREHRVRVGEVSTIPNDEALDLIERGIAKRVKD